jgi:hypothetical protein
VNYLKIGGQKEKGLFSWLSKNILNSSHSSHVGFFRQSLGIVVLQGGINKYFANTSRRFNWHKLQRLYGVEANNSQIRKVF